MFVHVNPVVFLITVCSLYPHVTGTCPAGKAFADIPSGPNKAHAVAECSNRGQCDRGTGQCKCFPPFTGSACEKSKLYVVLHICVYLFECNFVSDFA